MKTRIKKALNFIKWTFIWIRYWDATQDDRMGYNIAQSEGHEVYVLNTDAFGIDIRHDYSRPPQKRSFRTWKEFRELNKF